MSYFAKYRYIQIVLRVSCVLSHSITLNLALMTLNMHGKTTGVLDARLFPETGLNGFCFHHFMYHEFDLFHIWHV